MMMMMMIGRVALAAALSMLAACCNEGTGDSCLWLIVGTCYVAVAATMVPGGAHFEEEGFSRAAYAGCGVLRVTCAAVLFNRFVFAELFWWGVVCCFGGWLAAADPACVCSLRESTQQHATFLRLLSWLALVGAVELRLAAKPVWLSWLSFCMWLCHPRAFLSKCFYTSVCVTTGTSHRTHLGRPLPVCRLYRLPLSKCVHAHIVIVQGQGIFNVSLHSGAWRCCHG
jgi:hypothetical protein